MRSSVGCGSSRRPGANSATCSLHGPSLATPFWCGGNHRLRRGDHKGPGPGGPHRRSLGSRQRPGLGDGSPGTDISAGGGRDLSETCNVLQRSGASYGIVPSKETVPVRCSNSVLKVVCAASLLPDGPRPATLWDIDVDTGGEPVRVAVSRALDATRAKLEYPDVQAALDAGTAEPMLAILSTIGRVLQEAERSTCGFAAPRRSRRTARGRPDGGLTAERSGMAAPLRRLGVSSGQTEPSRPRESAEWPM